ncbi:hypothetical protein Tco_0070609 [Tanacetum coccineum]
METKDTLSSCSDLDEQEIQQLQKQAKNLKEISMNKLNALKTTTQRLERQTFTHSLLFERAFSRLFSNDVRTFKYELSQNMNNLEKQLNNEILHEKDSKSALSVIKVQFDKFIHSEMLKSSNYDSNAREARQDFKDYTQMEAQSFKDLIIQHMESIEQCIVERARHEQEIHNRLKRLNERKLQIQECMVQKVKASDASSGEKDYSRIVSDIGNDQGLENQSNTSRDESSRSRNECNDKSTSGDETDIRPSYDTKPMVEVDNTIIPGSPDMCDNEIQTDQNDAECDDERVALANLIANLKLDIDENKMIQKQLKKANASLTQELKACKSTLAETSRTLGESNSIRDSCLIALQNKQTELEKYMTFNDRTVDYDKLEHKLNETLGLLAQKEIDIKEGLKLKAYEISVVKEKHDELVKQSLLTKSHYEGLVKEKTKVITDLKIKEEKDIDKMISMEKQLKFLNEIVYKRNQSIQTIHMLAPKGPTFNGRPTFANPMYLKKAQSEKPCLYAIPYDQSDPANRLVPDREETLTLEKESRSKLNKDKVRPYDYTKLNSLYEIFKPPTQEYHVQLAHANEVRKKMWRKSFVKTKPNIFKNIDFLPVSKSISKSRQAYNVMTNNINHFRELVDQAWVKHSKDHFRAPTAHDMEILIKTCLMPLAIKTQNDSFTFVHELKQEMHADLKYVESLEKEIDELESDKAEFSNMYDILLQECVSNDVMCSYLHSLSDLDAHAELQCLYVHKVKECECLAQKLSKETEFVSKEVYTELLRSFAKLEKHSISLELALQQCQEQMKNDTVCKEKASNVFLKELEQYFETQDLKAQLQDKDIAISELKKLIEKNNGKGSNDMVHNYSIEEAKKKAQLQKDKALNTKPSVQKSGRLPNTANANKLKPRNFNQQPRNWPPSISSRVSNRTVNTAEPPRNQKPFLKSKDLACPTCKKCIYSENHDECILKYLLKVNSRVSDRKRMHNPIRQQRDIYPSYVLSWKPCQGDSLNLPDHRYKRRCCSLIPAESNSLPHAHAQTTKTYYKHQDSRIKKAQELKTKTSANSDTQDLLKDIKIIKTKIVKGDY